MPYQFRELRLHDIADALAFASGQGLSVTAQQLSHHLSLMVKRDDTIVAVALCTQLKPGRYNVRFAIDPADDPATTDALANELADRVLNKLQAQGIGTARVNATQPQQEDNLWLQTNWLEQIQPVQPPGIQPLVNDDMAASTDDAEASIDQDEQAPAHAAPPRRSKPQAA